MNTPIKILIAEHNLSDVDMIEHALKKSGLHYVSEISDNESKYIQLLRTFNPDVVLSDYTFPSFDGMTALRLKQDICPDSSFIFVTGTMGEERAVELIKMGADDYALKDRLFTLPPKITRALRERAEKKDKTRTHEKLRKAKQLYAFISQVNQNIVRVPDETTLFRNSCLIAVEFGKFKMAWIGLFNSENHSISLVEQSGIAPEDLSLFVDVECTDGDPQSAVLKTGSYFICNDIETDLKSPGWRYFALGRGINSFMVLPIWKSEQIIGTLNLYSSELHFSGTDEIALLVELTNDISFALTLFEREKKQRVTDAQLTTKEARFRILIEKSADLKTLSTKQGDFIYASPSVSKAMGYTYDEILQLNIIDVLHPDDVAAFLMQREALLAISGHTFHSQLRLKQKSGAWIWCEGNITNMLNEPGIHALVANFRDISEIKRAEDQRSFDKNNLHSLINNTDDLMWSVDRQFNLITSNQPFDRMCMLNFGYVIGKGEHVLAASYTPEITAHFKATYERAFAGESFTDTSYFEFPFEIWSEISYCPIRKGEEIIGTACHSRDITSTKIAERKLQRSESFNSGVLNSLSSHIAVIDASGIIVAVNESWKQFALENGETSLLSTSEGANYFDVCRKSAEAGAPEASDALQGIKDIMSGARSIYYIEYPCHSPFEKRWFGLTVIKFGGNEPLAVASHQNITERKLAEQNLIQSESRLKEAQAMSHVGNWELDFASNVHTWSDELYSIFGINRSDVMPSTELFLSFVHPEDVVQIRNEVEQSFISLEATSYNFRFIRKDGALRYGHTDRKFEFDQNDKPTRLLGVVHDITERKLIEEEREKMISTLVEHTKNLEQFTSIISHNLRAPVANILGIANVLRNTLSEEDRNRSQQFLFTATTQLDEMLKDLNTILQVKAEINEHKELVGFQDLVDVIKSSIRNVIEKEGVQIITDFEEIDSLVTIKSYMYSIFFNLVSNSIKYKREGFRPIIRIRSEISDKGTRISFKDNGIGINLAMYGDQIFGIYKRFHLHAEGKGLGLFMVKTQVETLGGTVRVESSVNEGTEFILEFPDVVSRAAAKVPRLNSAEA